MEALIKETQARQGEKVVPAEKFDNMKNLLSNAVDEKERQLAELREDYDRVLEEVAELHREMDSQPAQAGTGAVPLQEHERMRTTLEEQSSSMKRRLADITAKSQALIRQVEESEEEREMLQEQLEELKSRMKANFIPLKAHEEAKSALERAVEELEERVMIENDYVCLIDHEAVRVKLSNAVVEAEHRAKEALASYQSAQDGTVKLHQEMEAQKKELDTIQEAIQAKFVPLTAIEERENSYNIKLKDLTGKLSEMQEKYNQEKLEGERHKQEKEKLKVQMESVQQRMETGFVASEKHKEVEDEYRGKMEELTLRLVDLEQQYKDVTVQRAELEEQNALCNTDIQSLQQRLESELARLEHYEVEHRALRGTIHQAQDECQKAREAQRGEAQRACALEKELQGCSEDQAVLLQQHAQTKEALEGQVAQLLASLRQEQETSAQRAQNVAALQSELLRATQALEELGGREDQLSQLKSEKQPLCVFQISELLTDVERLKQALNGLSQLAYAGNAAPNKRQMQHIDTLQAQIKSLQQQLADAESQHREVVSIYRTHLLSAAQGHMDEDVQAALLQIIRMRQEFVC
eukprot:XP_014041963.1 PREDICTED: uveal autoantigen with coiled-coil domains and ankyrin repeats-like [Salmo salar]